MKASRISWKRITAEAVAIVASILLAFSIDAWWQERLERVEQLARLHAEFVGNVERIGGYQTRLAGGQEATEEIFSRIQESRVRGSANLDVPTFLLHRMIDTPTFEPDTPVFDGLVRSGQQAILTDRNVISSLSDWERELQNYAELAYRARQNVDAHLIPVLASRANLGTALMSKATSRELYDLEPNFAEVVEIEIDGELESYVAERYENGYTAQRSLGFALEAAERVVE